MLGLPSYRNQSIDLHSKSIDWFLYMATVALNGLQKLQNLILRIIHVWHCFVQYGFMRVWIFYLFFWKISFSWMQSDSNPLLFVNKHWIVWLGGCGFDSRYIHNVRYRAYFEQGAVQKGRHRKNGNFWTPFPHVIISHYFRVPPSPMSPSK